MPGRSPDQLTRILELLAAVTGYVTMPMGRFLLRESPSLPWGATLVVVTPVVTDELLASILQLRSAGRQMVLVSLAKETPPDLHGVLTHHLPDAIWPMPATNDPIARPSLFTQWREATP
jgi:hypothetical protein